MPSANGADQPEPLETRHAPSATWPSGSTCIPGEKVLSAVLIPLSVWCVRQPPDDSTRSPFWRTVTMFVWCSRTMQFWLSSVKTWVCCPRARMFAAAAAPPPFIIIISCVSASICSVADGGAPLAGIAARASPLASPWPLSSPFVPFAGSASGAAFEGGAAWAPFVPFRGASATEASGAET